MPCMPGPWSRPSFCLIDSSKERLERENVLGSLDEFPDCQRSSLHRLFGVPEVEQDFTCNDIICITTTISTLLLPALID